MTTTRLTIQTDRVEALLTNFPLAVILDGSNFDFAEAGSAGGGIFFSLDEDGNRRLRFARVFHDDSAEKAFYYVRVPRLWHKGSQYIYLHFSDIATDYAEPLEVFDTGYLSVVPLHAKTARCVILDPGETEDSKTSSLDESNPNLIQPDNHLEDNKDCTGLTTSNHELIVGIKCNLPDLLVDTFFYISSGDSKSNAALRSSVRLESIGIQREYRNFSLTMNDEVGEDSIDVTQINYVSASGTLESPYRFGKMAFRWPRVVYTAGTYNWLPDLTPNRVSIITDAPCDEEEGRSGRGALVYNGDELSTAFDTMVDFGNQDFTLEMWVRRTSNRRMGRIVEIDDNYVNMDDGGGAQFLWSNGRIDGSLDEIMPSGEWVHLALVRDSRRRKFLFYVNGDESVITSSTDGFDQDFSSVLAFMTSDGEDLDCKVDEIRLSRVARSAAWIATEYENGLGNLVEFP